MGIAYDYYSEKDLAISEILRVYDLAQTNFSSFSGFSSGRFVSGTYNPEALPALDTFEVFDIKKITTHGTIKKNNNPL